MRSEAGRRSDHAILHLRIDRQRSGPSRSSSGIRGYRSGDAQYRSKGDRTGCHLANAGDFVVHYAGAPCDMNTIGAIAPAHDLIVVEDAA